MGTSILASGLMTSLMAMVQSFTLLTLPNPSDPPNLTPPLPPVTAHLSIHIGSV